jgi:hypothetical protein
MPTRDVTDKYAEQLKEDLEWRKSVVETTGLASICRAGGFSWATWATKSTETRSCASRLTD